MPRSDRRKEIAKTVFICAATLSMSGFNNSLPAITNMSPRVLALNSSPKSFRVGEVKKRFPTEFCGSIVPNTSQRVLLNIDRDDIKYAWININGKDVRIKKLSDDITKRRNQIVKTVSKYQGENILVVVESVDIKNVSSPKGGLDYMKSRNQITVTYQGKSEKIIAEGFCA